MGDHQGWRSGQKTERVHPKERVALWKEKGMGATPQVAVSKEKW